MISEVYNEDCMEGMKRYPDGYFQLSIVDPPYGIGYDGMKASTSSHGGRKPYKFKGWDSTIPDKEYFDELFRVSENQIIFGANYFTEYLPHSMGWLVWDKGQRICNSDGELIFTSFDRALRIYTMNRVELMLEGTIHPTQKPHKLYKWLLKNYAKPGDKILDTHMGSQSSRIASFDMGFDFYGWEIDADYFRDGCQRFELFKSQGKLQFV